MSWTRPAKDLVQLSATAAVGQFQGARVESLARADLGNGHVMGKYHLDSVAVSNRGMSSDLKIELIPDQTVDKLRHHFSRGEVLNRARNLDEKFSDPGETKYGLVVHYPVQFECLRAALGYKRHEFQRELSASHKWFSSGGQTNTDFYKSDNGKYIAKCISSLEFENFQSIASNYFRYIFSVVCANKDTFLSKIVAVVEMKHGKEDKRFLVVMEGITYGMNVNDSTKTYDLKGSKMNRFLKTNIKSKTNLDTNFLLERNGDPIVLQMPQEVDFFSVLERDVSFLRDKELIDYSLLLVVNKQDKVVKVGIIDYLRKYDIKKKIEHNLKKIKNFGQDPTIVNPSIYADRFLETMHRNVIAKSHQSIF